MRTFFELKNPLPFESDTFDKMKDAAFEILQGAEKGQYTQAIVILTASGNQYSGVIQNAISVDKTDQTKLIDRLVEAKDTEIHRILCLWQDGGVDIPSFDVRNRLCRLNSANFDAGIFVMAKDGYSVIKLGITL